MNKTPFRFLKRLAFCSFLIFLEKVKHETLKEGIVSIESPINICFTAVEYWPIYKEISVTLENFY